jgi:Protein of unknown function (DUF3102)
MSEVIEIERHTFAAMLKSAGGNLKKMSAPRALSNRLSVEEWADIIRADIRRSVESIVAAGHHLREAKKQVEHGEWQPLLDRIGISGPTARKFMAIAEHPVISDRSHVNVLPPSWGDALRAHLGAGRRPQQGDRRRQDHSQHHAQASRGAAPQSAASPAKVPETRPQRDTHVLGGREQVSRRRHAQRPGASSPV